MEKYIKKLSHFIPFVKQIHEMQLKLRRRQWIQIFYFLRKLIETEFIIKITGQFPQSNFPHIKIMIGLNFCSYFSIQKSAC